VLIKISTRHGHLSEASQAKLQAKLEKLTTFFDRLTAIDLTVDLEHNDKPIAELRVSAEHKHDFLAVGQEPELAASVDAAIQKMEQQLRKYKEKVQEHRGPGLRQASAQTELPE
jgi:putative sigma-54 modulation protein